MVRHVACTQWEIVLRLNDGKMSMHENVKRGLAGKVILPDVVWHVFSGEWRLQYGKKGREWGWWVV